MRREYAGKGRKLEEVRTDTCTTESWKRTCRFEGLSRINRQFCPDKPFAEIDAWFFNKMIEPV